HLIVPSKLFHPKRSEVLMHESGNGESARQPGKQVDRALSTVADADQPSEAVIQAKLQHATAEESAGDLAELGRSDRLIAKGPGRMIEDVRVVHAKHHLVPLSDLRGLTHREVHTEHPGSGELSSL